MALATGSFSMISRLSRVRVPLASGSSSVIRSLASMDTDSCRATKPNSISTLNGRFERSSTWRLAGRKPGCSTRNS